MIRKILMCAAVMLAMTSCLKNDLPYPVIEAGFLSMVAEDEAGASVIDVENRVVTLNMAEYADLKKVNIESYSITEGAHLSQSITEGIDLTTPMKVTVTLYQDYDWTIMASQSIERYFTVEGQVGQSVIDVGAKRAIVYVSKNTDLAAVKITSLKLGPEGITTVEPAIDGMACDFGAGPVQVQVKYLDKDETWTLFVVVTDVAVDVTAVDAWTEVIWAYASAEEGKDNGFEYRKSGDAEWVRVPHEWITYSGGTFKACIRHLKAHTDYDVRAYSDELTSAVETVTTGGYYEIQNASFDHWWMDGKIWNPWAEGGTAYWGTGNKGATTLGDSNTFPSDDTWDGKPGYSAQLDTRFIGIATVGKLAAGNIFTGDYKRTDGTNGVLDFGRVCRERPTRLKGYWKYKNVPISHVSVGYEHLKGRPDTANVYIALADWTAPFEIRTNPKNLNLIDKNAGYIVAYGSVETGDAIENWQQFSVELKYRDTHRVPTYILIVGSASKLGDFFTGGSGSTLKLDNFSLEWDYE